ncbi:unnamed protein product [Brassicogethes aeneus]|uniref:SIAH-type domain-containing protein n=1 Tax=Brassicogethes aeneus TaxID=1431903 RepID=A0A9P0FLU1_BRAAE|nr:unnamed protein product [Brassicogethes aeneus]
MGHYENIGYSKNTIYLCPTDKKHICSWEGLSDDILQHFVDEHENLLFHENEIDVYLREESENRLLFWNEEIFLVQSKIVETNLLVYLRYLGPFHLAKCINYRLQAKTKTGACISNIKSLDGAFHISVENIKVDILTLKFTILLPAKEESSLVEISTENIIETVKPTKILKEIQEEIEDSDTILDDIFPDRRLKSFIHRTHSVPVEYRKNCNVKRNYSLNLSKHNDTPICSNCKGRLLPPAYLCQDKHSVCSECHKENRCNLCGKEFTHDRNYLLEEKCRNYTYPCKYALKGCNETLTYKNILYHETNCAQCDYSCCLPGCTDTGQLFKIKEHFKIMHGSIKLHEVHIIPFPRKSCMFLVHEKGVFYCESTDDENFVKWKVQFCGPKERKYSISLKFLDKTKTEKILKKIDNKYLLQLSYDEIKKMKLKNKSPTLNIGYVY